MKANKKTFSAGMNVGSSSILVTFVLLCLVTFAALSFVSAKADQDLTIQTADRIKAYYRADNMCEINLANIDSQLTKLAKECDEQTFYKNVADLFSDNDAYVVNESGDDIYISYSSAVSDNQELAVTLKVVYPSHPTADTFVITQWENISTYVPSEEPLTEEKGGLLF